MVLAKEDELGFHYDLGQGEEVPQIAQPVDGNELLSAASLGLTRGRSNQGFLQRQGR